MLDKIVELFSKKPVEKKGWKRGQIKVGGRVIITNDTTGEVLIDKKNIVVNAGLTHIRDRVSGLATVPDAMSYLAVGSSGTGPGATDTDLGTIIGSRQSATVTEPSSYVVKYAYTFAAGVSTGTWRECGVFDAASSGNMLCRVCFSDLTKGADDSFTVEYSVTFSDDGA